MKILYNYFVLKELEKSLQRWQMCYIFGVLCKLEYNGIKIKGMTFLNSLVSQINFFGENLRTCDMIKA